LHALALVFCLGVWTFLAMGGLENATRWKPAETATSTTEQVTRPEPPGSDPLPNRDRRRHYVFNLLNWIELWSEELEQRFGGRVLWVVNRAVWVPYVTAYDWLKFQDDVLGGGITFGRSIGVVAWLSGQPRVQLEQRVYAYQFGESPGGAGASNTVFFVDAKLAFGWPGAILYCLLFPLLAAAVFSSANEVAKVASVTSFFTAALSPLTATLLSGGLGFYIAISLLARTGHTEEASERAPHGGRRARPPVPTPERIAKPR
jgi:hypothetical protein